MASSDVRRAYEVLALPFNASPSDVRQAYRDLIAVWHPDRFQSNARLADRATQKTQEINTAYEVLCRYAQSIPSVSTSHASHPSPPPRPEKMDGAETTQAGDPPSSVPSDQDSAPKKTFGVLCSVIFGIAIVALFLHGLLAGQFAGISIEELAVKLLVAAIFGFGAWAGLRELGAKRKK